MTRFSVTKILISILLFIGLVSYTKIPQIADYCYWHTKVFIKNGCCFPRIRTWNIGLDAEEIKRLLPTNATVFFQFKEKSSTADSIGKVADEIIYQFYPLKVKVYDSIHIKATEPNYVIDYTGTLYPNASFLNLKSGQKLVDINHTGFLEAKPGIQQPEYIKVFWFLILSVFYIVIGCLLLNLLKFKATGWLHLLTTGYLGGLLIANIIIGLELLAGFSLSKLLVLATSGILTIIFMSLNRFKIKAIFPQPRTQTALPIGKYTLLYRSILGFTVFVAGLVIYLCVIRPVDYGDAISFWMLKSQMIFHHKAFVFEPVPHADYPILVSLSVSTNYALINMISDEIAGWGVALIYICLLSQIYSGTYMFTRDKLISLITVVLYVLLYFYPYITITPTGDQWIMVFLTCTAINAILYILNRQNEHLVLSFFFAIGLTLTKQEGLVYSSFIGFLILFFTFSGFRTVKPWLVFIAFSMLGILTFSWKAFLLKKGFYNGQSDFTNEAISLTKIYKLIKTQMLTLNSSDLQKGLVMGILIAFASIYKKMQLIEVQFLVFLIFLSWFFTFFSILPWSLDSMVRLGWTATPRLAVQSSPLIVILIGVLCRDRILEAIKPETRA